MAMPAPSRAQDAVGGCGATSAPYAEVQIDTLPRIDLELARTPQDHERGLMFRDSLPADSGMLFVYTAEARESYWMYNTLIPLSIAFIARDGTIVDIQDMARLPDPSDQSQAARFVYPSAAPYWYALEVNSGWFLDHGVGVGQQIAFCLGS
jgi:uncharacterized membrane protein (UPF0127 family)